jgi:uncharacterized SAM-binding protein YcdF (DUF218 family)
VIRRLLFLVLFAAGIIAGATVYLQPDDLKDCQEKPDSSKVCGSADAVVAISGGDTVARTNKAIELFKNGWGKYLIFSGAAEDKDGPSNALVMKQIAIKAGVDGNLIFIEENSESTKENAIELMNIFKSLSIERIILVTSGYHQRRAQLEFEKYTDNIVIVNHPVVDDKDWSSTWWLRPRGWWLVGGEIIKIIVFSLVGS